MVHFRDRHDVIDWAMAHIPKSYRTIARSFEEGQVEFLGGFNGILDVLSGWIIKTVSKYGNVCFVFIYNSIGDYDPSVAIIDEKQIDWKCWDGDKTDNPLYRGDHPEIYKELKDVAERR